MPAHEPPMLEDEPSGAPAPDAPSEPPAVEAAPRFDVYAPRTPEEIERAAVVRELVELKNRLPPLDPARLTTDWNWFDREYVKRADGALAAHAGRFVAVFREQVIGSSDDALRLRVGACKSTDPPVHPEQLVVCYVDPWDTLEG
jgi:hypothetical protein